MKFILFLKVKDPWLRLSQLNFYKIDPFFIKSAKIGNDFLRPLEELQDLQDSLYLFFMSLVVVVVVIELITESFPLC